MNLLEKEDLIRVQAEELEHASAEEVIAYAIKTFPNITFACAFGAEDVVLVDMIQKISPSTDIFIWIPIFTSRKHTKRGIVWPNVMAWNSCGSLRSLRRKSKRLSMVRHYGASTRLSRNIRKVEPLTRILSQYEAWITGIRRDQAPTRANSKKIEYDTKFGLVKFNPIAGWTSEDVWNYIRANDIIYNPPHDQNYPSIGREHCTRQVMPGEDPRAGRWSGHEKTECGLHK